MKTKTVSAITSTGKKKGKVLSIHLTQWEKSWKRLQKIGVRNSKQLGITSDADVEKMIDEGRR